LHAEGLRDFDPKIPHKVISSAAYVDAGKGSDSQAHEASFHKNYMLDK